MRLITVPIKFTGDLSVSVPLDISDADAKILAEKYAIAKVVAVTDSLDTEECELMACEELAEEFKISDGAVDKMWANTMAWSLGGAWEVVE